MLSPSGPGQASHMEDSSGSDAGSEASFGPLAAETDRFGFILVNGSTACSLGPPPESVRQRETKWISIIGQWDRILLKKTSKVKEQCQRGIPASLRAKCWPLLCGATEKMKHSNNLYQRLDSQSALQSWVDVIERDLDRQFPFHEMFLSRDGHGQRGLFRVLKAYTQYQPEEGYCQAQGPVAAVLLMNMPTEEAFWCLVQISEQYLPGYYSPLLEGVLFDAGILTWVLKRACPAAHRHLESYGVQPLMFATDWLMCLFTRHLPFNTLLRVWDLFFCYGVRVLFQVAVVLVRRVLGRAEKRQQCQGQVETLEKLRAVKEEVKDEDDSFIAEVCSVPLSGRDLKRQMEKQHDKWKKERPSSTFDPRGRCHGYQTASVRVLEREVERDRREKEKSNLSVPITRSVSNLSLSPSLLRKKWRMGRKADINDWEGRCKLGRNLSVGSWDMERETWADSRPKRVQRVDEKEEKALEEHQRDTNVTGGTKQGEHLKEPQPMSDNHIIDEEREHPKEQVEIEQPSRPGETEASKNSDEAPSKQTEHCCDNRYATVETELTQGTAETQSTRDAIKHIKQRVEPIDKKEEKAPEEHEGDTNITGGTKQGEHLKEPQQMSDNHSADGEREHPKVQEEIDQSSRPGETEASKSSDEAPSKQTEHCCDNRDATVGTELTQGTAETQPTGDAIKRIKQRVEPIDKKEEKAPEEHEGDTNITGGTKQGEHLKEPQQMSDKHSADGEREHPKEQEEIDQSSRPGETEASKSSDEAPSKQTEHCCDNRDPTVGTELMQGRAETQSTRNAIQQVTQTPCPISCPEVQAEELDCNALSQAQEQEQQNPNGENQEQEGERRDSAETQNMTVTLAVESDNMVAAAGSQTDFARPETEFQSQVETRATVDASQETLNQTDVKPELAAELDGLQWVELHAHTEKESDAEIQTQTETDLGSQRDGDVKGQTIKDPDSEVESNIQQEPNVSLEVDKSPQADQVVVKVMNIEPAEQIEIKESQIQTETDTSELAEMQEEMEENVQVQEGPVTEAQKYFDSCGDVSSLQETKRDDEIPSAENVPQKREHSDSADSTTTEMETEITVDIEKETQALESTAHSDEALAECAESEVEKEQPEQTETEGGIDLTECTYVEGNKETSNHILTDEETQTDLEAAEYDALLEEVETSTEPDVLTSGDETLQTLDPEQLADERPQSEVSISPVEENKELERREEKATESEDSSVVAFCQTDSSAIPQPLCRDKDCTMDSPSNMNNPPQQNYEDPHLSKEHVEMRNPAVHRTSTSSGDFRVRKSSSSQKSKFTRKLSEDLFTAPPQSISIPAQTEQPGQPEQSEAQPKPASLTSSKTQSDVTHSGASSPQPIWESTKSASEGETGGIEATATPQREPKQEERPTVVSKRFGLFRILRKEQPKIQVPKILIQDFSDGIGKERTVEEIGEEKLSSRERRRRRRERERKEKEEEKLRKKREKEQEKERVRERRKLLMRGKSFQVQGSRDDSSSSQTLGFERYSSSSSYADSYF